MGDSEQRKPWPGAQSHRMMVPTTEETGMSAPSEMWHSLWQCVSALWTLGVCQRGHISLQRFLKTPSRAIDKPSKKVKLIQLLWFIKHHFWSWKGFDLLSHKTSPEYVAGSREQCHNPGQPGFHIGVTLLSDHWSVVHRTKICYYWSHVKAHGTGPKGSSMRYVPKAFLSDGSHLAIRQMPA